MICSDEIMKKKQNFSFKGYLKNSISQITHVENNQQVTKMNQAKNTGFLA